MHYFVVNPNSRSGKGLLIWNKVNEELMNRQVEYSVCFTTKEHNGTKITNDILLSNKNVNLTVIGGDGTVNEVINGICNFDKVTFSYIPTGSSNDFARGLCLSKNIHKSLDNILNPKDFLYVDVGEVSTREDSKYFIVSCGVGFDAEVCFEALNSSIKNTLNKFNLGKLSYVGIAIKRLLFFKLFNLKIIKEGNTFSEYNKAIFMCFMNLPYEGGGLKLCPEALHNDNVLDTCLVNKMPKFLVLLLLPTAYKSKHTLFKGVNLSKCEDIILKTNIPVAIHTDGEYFGYKDKVCIKSTHKKLKVIRT